LDILSISMSLVVGKTEWQKLPVTLKELCINTTLRCGQSFRWQKINHEWTCTLHGRLLHLKQDSTHLHYKVTYPAPKPTTSEPKDTESLLRHYFNLDTGLESLYKQWSDVDSNFRKRAPQFQGVRILNQDAWETLIGFICSSNNNIARISQMVSYTHKHARLEADNVPGAQVVSALRALYCLHWRRSLP
jgi:N-glycosylase/DNA lyase